MSKLVSYYLQILQHRARNTWLVFSLLGSPANDTCSDLSDTPAAPSCPSVENLLQVRLCPGNDFQNLSPSLLHQSLILCEISDPRQMSVMVIVLPRQRRGLTGTRYRGARTAHGSLGQAPSR